MLSCDTPALARSARAVSQGNVTTMVGAGASHAIHHFRAQRRGIHDRQRCESNLKYDVADMKFPIVFVFRTSKPWCTHLWETCAGTASQAKLSAGHIEQSETWMKSRWFHVEYRFMNQKADSDIHTLLSCADSKSGSEKRLGQKDQMSTRWEGDAVPDLLWQSVFRQGRGDCE